MVNVTLAPWLLLPHSTICCAERSFHPEALSPEALMQKRTTTGTITTYNGLESDHLLYQYDTVTE